MKKFFNVLSVLLSLVLVVIGTGCASGGRTVGGPGNPVAYNLPVSAVYEAQEGATVEVPELGFVGTSPCKVRIPRTSKIKHVTVLVSKQGFEQARYDVEISIDGAGVAGLAGDAILLILPPIGIAALATDLSTGAYRGVTVKGGESEKEIRYSLVPLSPGPHAGVPTASSPLPLTPPTQQLSPGAAEFLRRAAPAPAPTSPPPAGDGEAFMTFGANPK